jgi:hypothetical protein
MSKCLLILFPGNWFLQLQRAVSCGDFMERLRLQGAILLSVVTCICHEDMSLASSAMTLLTSLGESPIGLNVLYSTQMVQALKEATAQRDVIRFRVYEVLVCEALNHFQYLWLFRIGFDLMASRLVH